MMELVLSLFSTNVIHRNDITLILMCNRDTRRKTFVYRVKLVFFILLGLVHKIVYGLVVRS